MAPSRACRAAFFTAIFAASLLVGAATIPSNVDASIEGLHLHSNSAKVVFGEAGDAFLARSATGGLAVGGDFAVGGDLSVGETSILAALAALQSRITALELDNAQLQAIVNTKLDVEQCGTCIAAAGGVSGSGSSHRSTYSHTISDTTVDLGVQLNNLRQSKSNYRHYYVTVARNLTHSYKWDTPVTWGTDQDLSITGAGYSNAARDIGVNITMNGVTGTRSITLNGVPTDHAEMVRLSVRYRSRVQVTGFNIEITRTDGLPVTRSPDRAHAFIVDDDAHFTLQQVHIWTTETVVNVPGAAHARLRFGWTFVHPHPDVALLADPAAPILFAQAYSGWSFAGNGAIIGASHSTLDAPVVWDYEKPSLAYLISDPSPRAVAELENRIISGGLGVGAVSEGQFRIVKDQLSQVERSLILHQMSIEHQTRMKGSSGLNLVRASHTVQGPRPYDAPANAGYGFGSAHNHADHSRTVGLAELNIVLNGVEFQTRHNDYRLVQPTTSSNYHSVEEIPFPDVPPSVLAQPTIDGQIAEMKEYFRAWASSDTSIRDYRPYFRPVLTYIEGTWIKQTVDFNDPFQSDRHQTLADSYEQLYDGISFIFASGAKDIRENMPWTPTALRRMGGADRDEPEWASWQYRMNCQSMPADIDLPVKKAFRLSDSLIDVAGGQKSTEALYRGRQGHFELNRHPNCLRDNGKTCRWDVEHQKYIGYELIDHLMSYVPGKDNHGAKLSDTAFGQTAYSYLNASELLNTGYYNRKFKRGTLDAAGRSSMYRGFNDGYMWAAMTSQERVHGLDVDVCAPFAAAADVREATCSKDDKGKFIPDYTTQKWSWAIPFEVVFLTPLAKWNPYNFTDHGRPRGGASSGPVFDCGAGVRCDGTAAKPYNGVDAYHHYLTPTAFYNGLEVGDPADTSGASTWISDQSGEARSTVAAGTWMHLPEISGLEEFGPIRTRFPIAPIHDYGNTAFKELKALQDLVLTESWEVHVDAKTGDGSVVLKLMLGGAHEHLIYLDAIAVAQASRDWLSVRSEESASHSHTVSLRFTGGQWTAQSISSNQYDNHALSPNAEP